MSKPFIERKAGDFITAQDWNEIQIKIRDFLNKHSHNGDDDQGGKLDGAAVTETTDLSVKSLAVAHILSAKGKALSINCNTGIGFEAPPKAMLAVNGGLHVGGAADPGDKNLLVDGNAEIKGKLSVNANVGIGTSNPKAKLAIMGGLHVGGDSDPGNKNLLVDGNTEIAGKLTVNGNTIQGSTGRNYFKDAEKNDGGGLRVGAAWGMYGIYAQIGQGVVGGKDGVNLQHNLLVVKSKGNVGIGTTDPKAKLDVNGYIFEKLEVIKTGNNDKWAHSNHPIMKFFKNKLSGRPVGTMVRAIQDHKKWRGHYWQGWVDCDGKIRVIHNYHNTPHVAK
ncbi:MAG: hypothetical protein OEV42_04565 [Deltaproteobacteria bacterium]|nr:hypothetical protein [Deltaproteobacteria bacterium]